MVTFNSSRFLWIVLVGVLVFDGTAHGGGPVLNLDGSEWEFAETLAKFKAKAQGIGKVKVSGVQGTVLALQPGNLWVATIDATVILQGTYTRKSATAKRLILTLDTTSTEILQNLYAQQVEAAAAAQGLPLDVTVTLTKAKTTVKLKVRSKTDSAVAKLKMGLKFTAAISTPFNAGVSTGKIVSKLKGVSASIPLSDITAAAQRRLDG